MLIKRLAAIILALMITFQLAACKKETNYASGESSIQAIGSQMSGEEESSADGSHSADPSVSSERENSNKNEPLSSANTSDEQQNNSSQAAADKNEASSDKNNQQSVSSQQGVSSTPVISCSHSGGDPYQNVSKSEFYANYKPACCNLDATYRSQHGLLSGSLDVPGQYVSESQNRPMNGKKYLRNTTTLYLDGGNTYVVLDANGKEAMRIHKAGGYITLEEVAAYMFAFGGSEQIPANYTAKKKGKPLSSIWGEYLRVNHSYFIGDTDRYPYEPELPDISGCGGRLRYYEMDIGTTGTETPGYPAKPYIVGNKINRGAARIVYARQDLNGNGVYENNEVYVFYTHNHYNDFREYLNYYGGWGEMFGNITGGGVYSSETKANPTPYVTTTYKAFLQQ